MNLDTLTALCHSLTKTYSIGIRLYQDTKQLYNYSVYPLDPDPAGPYIPRILDCGAEAGSSPPLPINSTAF